jgi:hypothetical protein
MCTTTNKHCFATSRGECNGKSNQHFLSHFLPLQTWSVSVDTCRIVVPAVPSNAQSNQHSPFAGDTTSTRSNATATLFLFARQTLQHAQPTLPTPASTYNRKAM